jgi:hypothetical protein
MSKKTCCGNATVEWPVGTMQGKLQHGRFGKADYGGQRCCGMHTYSEGSAICAKERGNHKSRHRCRISPFFCWNPSRNGDSTLSVRLTLPQPRQVTGVYSLQRIIAQSGWRRKHYGTIRCRPPLNFYTSISGVVTDAL